MAPFPAIRPGGTLADLSDGPVMYASESPSWWRGGWLPVPRAILKPSPPHNPACKTGALVGLLSMAEWNPDGLLPRGTLDVTHKALALRFRWSVDTVRRWLAELAEAGIITIESGTGKRPTRITFVDFDPPKASAHPQSLVAQRESPRPRHPQDGKRPQASAHPQSPVPVGLSRGQCITTVSSAHPQPLAAVEESADARHRFLSTDASREVVGKAGREQICGCGRVTLRPGDFECSTCRIERAASANLRALDLDEEDAQYLRDEREGMQMEEPPDER